MTQKISAYLGFCIRSGKIVYGVDEIAEHKKRISLLIIDGGLSENSRKEIYKAQERLACPLLETETDLLGELLHKPAVKAVAIKEKNLAAAVLSAAAASTKLKLIRGGKE